MDHIADNVNQECLTLVCRTAVVPLEHFSFGFKQQQPNLRMASFESWHNLVEIKTEVWDPEYLMFLLGPRISVVPVLIGKCASSHQVQKV